MTAQNPERRHPRGTHPGHPGPGPQGGCDRSNNEAPRDIRGRNSDRAPKQAPTTATHAPARRGRARPRAKVQERRQKAHAKRERGRGGNSPDWKGGPRHPRSLLVNSHYYCFLQPWLLCQVEAAESSGECLAIWGWLMERPKSIEASQQVVTA